MSNLNILSFNIESFTSNKLYLDTLSKRADIILLQEHWLYEREKYLLEEYLSNFICAIKCFDEDLVNDPIERKRGHAGVAICFNIKLQSMMEILPDGGKRIICIRINALKPLTLICVYMPTRGGSMSLDDYKSILDELSEIIEKYKYTSDIIIGGDMNASLHRTERKISYDIALSEFLQDNALNLPDMCQKQSTFYHFNNKDESQIDYFLQSASVVKRYLTFQREFQNTSTHDPIMVVVECSLEKVGTKVMKNRTLRINWDKIDKQKYQDNLEENLKDIIDSLDTKSENELNIDKLVTNFSDVMVKTAEDLCPRRKFRRRSIKRDWTPEMTEIMKVGKYYYWKWKQEGKKDNRDSVNYKKMREQKKKLRSAQRRLSAAKREQIYTKIMDLNENNDKQFFALVNKQRSIKSGVTSILKLENNIYNTPQTILGAWADYFEGLATPACLETFDDNFLSMVRDDVDALTKIFTGNRQAITEVDESDIRTCILSFKNGKAPDETKMTVEHMKFGGDSVIFVLTKIVNLIFSTLCIPKTLKSGMGCPIYKNGGKPIDDPNSYRRITVTSAIGKVLEKLHLSQNKSSIRKHQSYLQKGFTEGEAPTIAGLVFTELNIEAKEENIPIVVALTDAKKAFDIVWHEGLFREMNKIGIEGDNWLLFKEWYTDLNTRIKWDGNISRHFEELQGVRQGGVWSPTAYKVFINSLLKIFEEHKIGSHIGSVYCGVPTVADDVTLIANNPFDLQTMIDIQIYHANKFRYVISDQKSCVLKFRDKSDFKWTMNDKELNTPTYATHLGIKRDINSKFGVKEVVPDRIQTARKTVYALMGAGLYGLNGINPMISIHMIKCFVIPRLLYGIDVVRLSKGDTDKISNYFIKLLKQIQHLPVRTANSAVLILAGQLPIESEIHKRMLSTFRNIVDNKDSVEYKIALRQLSLKSKSSDSWFIQIVKLTELYQLPMPLDLFNNTPEKLTWKKFVNSKIENYWKDRLIDEAKSKSSLRFLNIEALNVGTVHNVWKSSGTEMFAIKRACIKSKLICGTYTLQIDRAKFKQYTVSSFCPLCLKEPEDTKHFILKCHSLKDIRQSFFQKLRDLLSLNISPELNDELFGIEGNLLQLVLDCTKFHFLEDIQSDIERLTCSYCFALHQKRSSLI